MFFMPMQKVLDFHANNLERKKKYNKIKKKNNLEKISNDPLNL